VRIEHMRSKKARRRNMNIIIMSIMRKRMRSIQGA